MAAPVGHIVCALALLNSGTAEITDKNAFLAGTSFPDIRYISHIKRSITHNFEGEGLKYVLSTDSSFEAGRRFHVLVDREREKHMRRNNAYRFVNNGPLKTQMLKIVEDHILFSKLKNKVDTKEIFKKIYNEELDFTLSENEINNWHKLLFIYLNQNYWFNFYRYYKTLYEFQKLYGMPKKFFHNIWQTIRTLGFFVYAYFQVEKLSRDEELRTIILDFYEEKINSIIQPLAAKSKKGSIELSLNN